MAGSSACGIFPTRAASSPSNYRRQPPREQEKSGDPLVKIFKVKAELEGVIDLSEFPFDSHVLPLSVEDRNELVTYFAAP